MTFVRYEVLKKSELSVECLFLTEPGPCILASVALRDSPSLPAVLGGARSLNFATGLFYEPGT